MVQFSGPIAAADLDTLARAGTRIVGYVPYNAYVIFTSDNVGATLAGATGVQWVSPLQPSMRFAPPDSTELVQSYRVQLVDVPEAKAAIASLAATGAHREVKYDAYVVLDVDLAPSQVTDLLRSPFVVGVEEAGGGLIPFTSKWVATPGLAKNVITVGGTENVNSGLSSMTTCPNGQATSQTPNQWLTTTGYENIAYLSRRSTSDGRIKPDLLAPATRIHSTHHQTTAAWCETYENGRYATSSGTSFAAPQAAAAVVLLHQKNSALFPWYNPMGAAMAKAALIGNAKSIKGTSDGWSGGTVAARPDANGQGFGRLHLQHALASGTSQRFFDGDDFTSGFLAPFTGAGQVRTATFTVADSSKPVNIVLAWSDEPASVPAQFSLVNDLDLLVGTTCGTNYVGNLMSVTEISTNVCGYWYSTDTRNNVEIVTIPAGTSGTVTLRIETTTWGSGSTNFAKQPFAVYVSNGL